MLLGIERHINLNPFLSGEGGFEVGKRFLSIVSFIAVIIMLAVSANAAQEMTGFAVLSPLGMVVLTNLLLFTLFVLLAAVLVRQSSSKYYNRIRLREPKIGERRKAYNLGQALRLALWIVIAIAIIVALFFTIYFTIKLAPAAISHIKGNISGLAGNQTNQTAKNISGPVLNKTAILNKTMTNVSGNLSAQEKKTDATNLFSRLITDYGVYLIFGFILLILLVSVISRKINH
jgi:uncharacterized membrane protein YbaN (DUF454 family)